MEVIAEIWFLNSFSWWRYQMETFPALLALSAENSPVPVNSPHKGQWRGALMFSLISDRINSWVNYREAGDLRRHRAHYNVIVMLQIHIICFFRWNSCHVNATKPSDDKSTLFLVIAWCRRATGHYPSQCWPRFISHMASLVHNKFILATHIRQDCLHFSIRTSEIIENINVTQD